MSNKKPKEIAQEISSQIIASGVPVKQLLDTELYAMSANRKSKPHLTSFGGFTMQMYYVLDAVI